MGNYDEIDLLAARGEEPREIQTELVEWQEVSPRSHALRLRTWDLREQVEE